MQPETWAADAPTARFGLARNTVRRSIRSRCVAAAIGVALLFEGTNGVKDLREALTKRRCLPEGHKPLYDFKHDRVWVLEANRWDSHRLIALIAGILLQEHAGYGVEINSVASGASAYKRVAKEEFSGDAMVDLLARNVDFGYANLEVWPAGQRGDHSELVASRGTVQDMGYVGYDGRSGWFISESFAGDTSLPQSPEFYRAYDTSRPAGRAIQAALQRNGSVVNCSASGACCCRSAAMCPAYSGDGLQGDEEIHWCPSPIDKELPAVLAASPSFDQGYNEEIARSNGFQLGLRYLGSDKFSGAAGEALSANDGVAQIVHSWRPSLLLTRLQLRGEHPLRIMLPSEECGTHLSDGSGNWSCDFPSQSLSKLASSNVKSDPIMSKFFTKFSIPASGGTLLRQGSPVDLVGAGMQEILASLAVQLPDDMSKLPDEDDFFDAACAWVRANEFDGIIWGNWMQPRRVPFFADTLNELYPFPLLFGLLILALGFIVFVEAPWLWTTLNPKVIKRIFGRSTTGHCRTELEVRLRQQCPEIVSKSQSAISLVDNRPARCCSIPVKTNGFASASHGDASGNSHRDCRLAPLSMESSPSKRRRWSQNGGEPGMSPVSSRLSGSSGLADGYWKGLFRSAYDKPNGRRFWERVEEWVLEEKDRREPREPDEFPFKDYVHLAHHTFPCFQKDGVVIVPLRRSEAGAASGTSLDVEVVVEESTGGAKAGTDFEAGIRTVHFAAGREYATLTVKVMYHEDFWQNSYWFQVRIRRVLEGRAALTTPAQAAVVVLDEDTWPANIPGSKRGGWGLSLMRYFVRMDRLRRGEKWRKTMIAMCWLPVHSVFVSTIVQKMLVDHAVAHILDTNNDDLVDWFYWEVILLAGVQFVSLGLNRWADVVQTRNRGRTGGIRQHHRGQLLQKFMNMEHSEHWLASDASWLYSTIYDADVITGNAYFMVFVLAQSIVALMLSVSLAIGLAFWSFIAAKATGSPSTPITFGSIGFILGVIAMIPMGLAGVFMRRKLLWVAVIARKDLECAWFKSCTWIVTNWRYLNGFVSRERAALISRVQKQNEEFIPAHWDARDTMNDTAWVTHWMQGVAYSFMLIFGSYALSDLQKYGIGTMEVGTFYALCKIYLSVGKYVGRLTLVFVDMQKAVVSLREIAALLNQKDQRSQRRQAKMWATLSRMIGKVGSKDADIEFNQAEGSPDQIVFPHGMCFVRPHDRKVGSIFAELKLKHCRLPLGRVVRVTATNERVLRSFLGLASKVLHATTATGDELPFEEPGVMVPQALQVMLLPMGSVRMGATAPSIIEQLEFTGAPTELCCALAESVGLDPHRSTANMGIGASQVFTLIRAMLLDPDVLCAFRPLALVPMDMRRHMGFLLRLWQGGGGLRKIAEYLSTSPLQRTQSLPERVVWRSSARSLIIGNAEEDLWGGFRSDLHVDLDEHLWKDELEDSSEEHSTLGRQSSPKVRFDRPIHFADIGDIYGGE